MIYTSPIDYFFDYKFGKLPYRSIRFEWKNLKATKLLKATSYNFVGQKEQYTRITEYKQMTGQISKTTSASYEFPTFVGEEFYPIPSDENDLIYKKYKKESEKLKNILFVGRLSEYKYYNMDQVVGRVLQTTKKNMK